MELGCVVNCYDFKEYYDDYACMFAHHRRMKHEKVYKAWVNDSYK